MAAGAVGMAFGPALSAVFNEVNFTVAGVVLNGLTNPGWIMFVLWVILGWIIQTEFQVRLWRHFGWRNVINRQGARGRCWTSPPLPPPPW